VTETLVEERMAEPPAPPPSGGKGRRPMNPVLARELRVRLRSGRSWVLLTIYLLVLAIICFLVFEAQSSGLGGDPFSAPSPTRFAAVGRSIFEWLILFMLLLVLFLVPGFTSGAIAGERERQTLVPLQVTLLRPWQILVGKLGASFAFIALLVVATMPMLGVAYLIGGLTIQTVFEGVGVVLFTGVVLSCLTLLCSTVFRRVQTATVAAYGMVLVLLLGTFLSWVAAGIVDSSRGNDSNDPPAVLLLLNPLFLAADVFSDDTRSVGDVSSPFEPMEQALADSSGFGSGGAGGQFDDRFAIDVEVGFGRGFGPDLGSGPDGRPIVGFDDFGNPIFIDEAADTSFPFWGASVIGLYLVSLGAILFSVRRLRTPAEVER
jgi:ABC-2 type transport system permease protein